jgi:hypothetical protein
MMLKILKTTSVAASCAKACTLLFRINRHQTQQSPFTITVHAMIAMAGAPSSTSRWSFPPSLPNPSNATCTKDVIMMTENTSTPMGSSRRRPTG